MRLKSWHGIQCEGHCRALALLLRRSRQYHCAQVGCVAGRAAPPWSLRRQVPCGGIWPCGELTIGAYHAVECRERTVNKNCTAL
jgi:hypothetical protein